MWNSMTDDLANPLHLLALVCGLLFIPHILAAFTSRDAVVGFFQAAGFKPPLLFVSLAVMIETLVSISLIFRIWLPVGSAVAALFMFSAGAAAWKVSNRRWVWNLGGCEFHMFWGFCCALIAAHS